MVRRIESLTERCVYGGYVIERYSVGNLELSNSTLSRIYVVANNRRQAVRRILAVYLSALKFIQNSIDEKEVRKEEG